MFSCGGGTHGSTMSQQETFESKAMAHMDAAFNLALCLLRSRADAEDATHDAFLRAFRAKHQLQGEDVKPWLLTIVRNVCYRRLQDRRRLGNVVSIDEMLGSRAGTGAVETALSTPAPSPEQRAIAASDHDLLARALAELPPVFREVIVLREIEGLSYRAIADVIGAPVGTVMSRLSRARLQLRAALGAMMEHDDKDAM